MMRAESDDGLKVVVSKSDITAILGEEDHAMESTYGEGCGQFGAGRILSRAGDERDFPYSFYPIGSKTAYKIGDRQRLPSPVNVAQYNNSDHSASPASDSASSRQDSPESLFSLACLTRLRLRHGIRGTPTPMSSRPRTLIVSRLKPKRGLVARSPLLDAVDVDPTKPAVTVYSPLAAPRCFISIRQWTVPPAVRFSCPMPTFPTTRYGDQ
ncbi:hypothetical protein FRC12_003630 [Ceratobasidium sp. 428]|nr:hypothetical protein FRC12_003630 [Ceratobasidium sp. 428]